MSAKEEPFLENPLNNEEGNLRDGETWVTLNESQDNKYELQRTVKELRLELIRVKEDNKRILKDQDKLNTILLAKIHNDKKEKNKGFEHELPKLHLTNIQEENWNFSVIKLKLPMKNQSNNTKENNKILEKVVMITKRKRSTNPMRKYLGSLKYLNL